MITTFAENTVEEGEDMTEHSKIAKALFKEGYNCCQAVVLAFSDVTNVDKDLALKAPPLLEGGMGRLREVCGALTGTFVVAGVLFGYTNPKDNIGKAKHYEVIQDLAKRFKEENGSLLCRELLGLNITIDSPVPEKRTEEYYKSRPCADIVESAASIMDQLMASFS